MYCGFFGVVVLYSSIAMTTHAPRICIVEEAAEVSMSRIVISINETNVRPEN